MCYAMSISYKLDTKLVEIDLMCIQYYMCILYIIILHITVMQLCYFHAATVLEGFKSGLYSFYAIF